MHVITVLRDYLGLTQQELAGQAGITQGDLCEMETREPYGSIAKYMRVSRVLDVPVHTLVCNDYTGVPAEFFRQHPHAPYHDNTVGIGREGEEEALRMERERLAGQFETLSRLVLPYFKMKHHGKGYDILSFDNEGSPIYIEVKTTVHDPDRDFHLTVKEHEVARKLTAKGEQYFVYRFTEWGTKRQKLHVIPFREMVEGARIVPSSYTCSMKDRPTTLTGIAYHRRKRGITQGDLAAQLSMKQPHFHRYESGARLCPVDKCKQLSQLLEVPIDALLDTYPLSALDE